MCRENFPTYRQTFLHVGKSFLHVGKSFFYVGKNFLHVGKSFFYVGKSFLPEKKPFSVLRGELSRCCGENFLQARPEGSGAAGYNPWVSLLYGDQFQLKYQKAVCRNRAGNCGAKGKLRRDDHEAFLADLHVEQSLLPADYA